MVYFASLKIRITVQIVIVVFCIKAQKPLKKEIYPWLDSG